MTQKYSRLRLLLLLPALLLFTFGVHALSQHLAFLDRLDKTARPLPPTMYGEHSGMAVAFFALGLVFVAGAIRKV